MGQAIEDSNGFTSTSTEWVVSCPDGQHTFSTRTDADVVAPCGSAPIRTAGPAFLVMPVAQANDYTMGYFTLTGVVVLFGALAATLLTQRPPVITDSVG